MAGNGKGRGRKKRARTEALTAAAPQAAAAAAAVSEEEVRHHTSRSMMMTTPLGALMRIEATIWMNSRGGRIMSLDDFYSLARSHEWLGLINHNKVNSSNANGGGADGAKLLAPTMVPKGLAKLCNDVYELISQLSEEERLIFDVMAVSAWDLNVFPKLYPLYRLHSSTNGKIQLEVLQQPQLQETKPTAATSAKSSIKVTTRSEILGNRFHHSRKFFSFSSTSGKSSALQYWWEHAKNVVQMILTHRESMVASVSKVENDVGKSSLKSLVANNDQAAAAAASPTKQTGAKKTTLEERVRARSQRNEAILTKAMNVSKKNGDSPSDSENKALLELANALRAYSQRRVSTSSSGGGSALERLKNRGSSGGSSGPLTTNNIARLTVTNMIKDARISWMSVVNESLDKHDSSGGIKTGRGGGGATQMVSIDLSRVLFQLRLKMVPVKNMSDKRQMETQLLCLLEKLATLVPKWIHLRKAPSTLAGSTTLAAGEKTGNAKGTDGAASKANATTNKPRLNIRQSIIVIRNDAVNYSVDVRAKLGGRVHNPGGTSMKGNGKSNAGVSNIGNKRPRQGIEEQRTQNATQGPVGVADAIVPPSFLRRYGSALGLEKAPKKK